MAKRDEKDGKPELAGKSLRDIPLPIVNLWRDEEFGIYVMREFQERVRHDYDNNPHLQIFKVTAHIVHGSNPFAACLVDMIVRPETRVAALVDLQAILDSRLKAEEPLSIRGTYQDAALVLRSVSEPNAYLAERINEQVGRKLTMPIMVSLTGTKLIRDDKSPYGLSFEVTRDTEVFRAPVLLESSGHFSGSAVDRNTGLPEELGGAGRYFYGMEDGLSRLYLGRGGSIDTIWEELGNSQVDGRVVLVENSVSPGKLSQYLQALDAATDLLEA